MYEMKAFTSLFHRTFLNGRNLEIWWQIFLSLLWKIFSSLYITANPSLKPKNPQIQIVVGAIEHKTEWRWSADLTRAVLWPLSKSKLENGIREKFYRTSHLMRFAEAFCIIIKVKCSTHFNLSRLGEILKFVTKNFHLAKMLNWG